MSNRTLAITIQDLTKENMITAMVCFEVDRVAFGLDALLKKPHPTNDLEPLVKDYIHFLMARLAMGDALANPVRSGRKQP